MINSVQSWVADKDRSIRWALESALQKADIRPRCFSTAGQLLHALETSAPDAILTDTRMPGMDGFALLERLTTRYPTIPVIIMSARSDLDSAVSAFQGGAFEYLPKPFDLNEAVDLIRRACSQGQRQRLEPDDVSQRIPDKTPEIIGEAPAMQEVFRAIARLARSHITVLINGESGTGKELVARALHRHSPRANKAFIALNMAAIPRDLLESELFGHERGAFTGAQSRRIGRFEQADGGTLFLDEIGDMPAELQTRLLRVLSDGEFFSVGAHTPTRVDVRIVAATHQNLEALVAQGRFREDLFHRLNVIRLHIPPIRDRRQDIPALLRHFLIEAGRELGVDAKALLPEVEACLCRLDWPGNVRQIENTCRWITVMGAGREVHLDDLPPELLQTRRHETDALTDNTWQDAFTRCIHDRLSQGGRNVAKDAMDISEGILITTALKFTHGRRQEAAKLLGYGRNTLTRKISELKLVV
jgi:two-component system nitrogen regulation response regulator GlnG